MKKFENIIIASDLDGTFLSTECTEVARNIEKIKYFTDNGGLFTFATGRIASHVQFALPNATSYVNAPVVACNGMQLFDIGNGVNVKKTFVDTELHYKTVTYLRERYPSTYYRTMTENGIAHFQPDHYYAVIEKNQVNHIYATPEEQKKLGIYKLTLRDKPEILDEIKEVIELEFGEYYTVCKSWSDLLEIIVKGHSKAVMLKELQSELSADGKRKTLYAVGDHENDLEMLKMADVAVCPENAIESVKAICDHCFCDNDSGVIADLIEFIDSSLN